jgi:hypothetical protein
LNKINEKISTYGEIELLQIFAKTKQEILKLLKKQTAAGKWKVYFKCNNVEY